MLVNQALLCAVVVALVVLAVANLNTVSQSDQQVSLEREEWSEDEPKVSFEGLDRDGDGELDEDELNTYGAPAAQKLADETDRGARMLEQMDEDDSGSVNEQEFEDANSRDGANSWN